MIVHAICSIVTSCGLPTSADEADAINGAFVEAVRTQHNDVITLLAQRGADVTKIRRAGFHSAV